MYLSDSIASSMSNIDENSELPSSGLWVVIPFVPEVEVLKASACSSRLLFILLYNFDLVKKLLPERVGEGTRFGECGDWRGDGLDWLAVSRNSAPGDMLVLINREFFRLPFVGSLWKLGICFTMRDFRGNCICDSRLADSLTFKFGNCEIMSSCRSFSSWIGLSMGSKAVFGSSGVWMKQNWKVRCSNSWSFLSSTKNGSSFTNSAKWPCRIAFASRKRVTLCDALGMLTSWLSHKSCGTNTCEIISKGGLYLASSIAFGAMIYESLATFKIFRINIVMNEYRLLSMDSWSDSISNSSDLDSSTRFPAP